MTDDELAAALDSPEHPFSDLVYAASSQTRTGNENQVLVYEKAANHRDGINVLRGDGSVVWLEGASARELAQRYRWNALQSRPSTMSPR